MNVNRGILYIDRFVAGRSIFSIARLWCCAGVAGKVLATYVAVALQSTVMMLVNNALQDAVGRVKVGPGPRQWSFQYFVASANAAVTFYNACFGESLWKGSPAWVCLSSFLKHLGNISVSKALCLKKQSQILRCIVFTSLALSTQGDRFGQ